MALIQESKLRAKTPTPTFSGYSTLRLDRPGDVGGGGLLALISRQISYTHTTRAIVSSLPPDNVREVQTLSIRLGKEEYNLANVYLPPTSSCPPSYVPELGGLASSMRSLVLGDFNAHDPAWLSTQSTDVRATTLLDQLEEMVVLNGDEPTRIPFTTGSRPTSPDVAFASPDISLRCDWRVFNELSSDHMPVTISLELSTAIQAKPRHTFLNYRKADWASFASLVEDGLSSFAINSFQNVDSAADALSKVILAASARSIPSGHVRRYNPSFTPEIRQLMRERTQLRSQLPTPHSVNRVRGITAEIDTRVRNHTSAIWKEVLDSVNYRTNPSKLWKLVRGLNNRNSGIPAGHEALLAPGSTLIPSPREQANSLIQHYAAISRLPHRPEDRIIKRSLHRISVDPDFRPFSSEMVRDAVAKAGGSKARGIDGISYPQLKHLGPKALDALTALFNWSVKDNCIPTRWKVASVIPLLKPGKDPTTPSSYRPISLLSNTCKVLERLVLNEVSPYIPLSPTQHGFPPAALHYHLTVLTYADGDGGLQQ